MITKYIKDSIINTELQYIAHGVNCQNVMGSGVAKVLFKNFPDIKSKYHLFCKNKKKEDLLGCVQIVRTNHKEIFNCFTQFDFGNSYKNNKRYVNYSAIVKCFTEITEVIGYDRGYGPLAIPKIGCGLAGGDWQFVEQLINDTIGDNLEVWVYEV